MIPYFDKVVHFGFYFGETLLVLLLFEPRGWRRWTAVAAVILCSGAVELVQGALGYRSKVSGISWPTAPERWSRWL